MAQASRPVDSQVRSRVVTLEVVPRMYLGKKLMLCVMISVSVGCRLGTSSAIQRSLRHAAHTPPSDKADASGTVVDTSPGGPPRIVVLTCRTKRHMKARHTWKQTRTGFVIKPPPALRPLGRWENAMWQASLHDNNRQYATHQDTK